MANTGGDDPHPDDGTIGQKNPSGTGDLDLSKLPPGFAAALAKLQGYNFLPKPNTPPASNAGMFGSGVGPYGSLSDQIKDSMIMSRSIADPRYPNGRENPYGAFNMARYAFSGQQASIPEAGKGLFRPTPLPKILGPGTWPGSTNGPGGPFTPTSPFDPYGPKYYGPGGGGGGGPPRTDPPGTPPPPTGPPHIPRDPFLPVPDPIGVERPPVFDPPPNPNPSNDPNLPGYDPYKPGPNGAAPEKYRDPRIVDVGSLIKQTPTPPVKYPVANPGDPANATTGDVTPNTTTVQMVNDFMALPPELRGSYFNAVSQYGLLHGANLGGALDSGLRDKMGASQFTNWLREMDSKQASGMRAEDMPALRAQFPWMFGKGGL